MPNKLRLTNIAGIPFFCLFFCYVVGEMLPYFCHSGAMAYQQLPVTHAGLTEIGRKTDGSLLSDFYRQLPQR